MRDWKTREPLAANKKAQKEQYNRRYDEDSEIER